jgi:hypothetical protein
MTIQSLHRQSLRINAEGRLRALAARFASRQTLQVYVGVMAFFCFMPYPAMNVGGTSALQIGNLLTFLACLPIVQMAWRRWPLYAYPLIVLPLLLSAAKIILTGQGDIDLCLKAVMIWMISGLALIATQLWAPQFALELLCGIAVATVVHVGVGVWQFYSFDQGQLPVAWIYVNQSFLSVQENADRIAQYTQRPFGLFPEPSAMACSLAPFVVFWMSQMCGLVRLRREPNRWQRRLFAVAALGGLGLIILSQSGHAAMTVASVMLLAAIWLIRCRATKRNYVIIVAILGVVLPLLLWAVSAALSTRLGGDSEMGNASWEERSTSLVVGFNQVINGGAITALFGLGVGMSGPIVYHLTRIEAVFSVLLVYVYETGLVGVAVVAWIAHHMMVLWKALGYDLTFLLFAGLWLLGVTVTTSYAQLLTNWLALGWLTTWPAICLPATAADALLASPRTWTPRRFAEGRPMMRLARLAPDDRS